MTVRVLALDLERTLIDDAHSARPRPGLREFLVFCQERFGRVALLTTVEEADAREVVEGLGRSRSGGREREGCTMPYERTTRAVREALCAILAQVDAWFDRGEALRGFKPASGGWSVDQVLEHITRTNHFLMLTLRKWVAIAEQRARRGDPTPEAESDLGRLEVIGQRGSFQWVRPEHMEPTGAPSSAEVRGTLRQQLGECLILLERISGGVGALCRVTMTVNALGKIDLYQWLYFLAQHARRHLQQLASLEAEFGGQSSSRGALLKGESDG